MAATASPPSSPLPTGSLGVGATKALSKAEASSPAFLAELRLPVRDVVVERSDVGHGLDAFVLDGVLTREECAHLVGAAEASGCFSFWNPAAKGGRRDFRNADTIEVTHVALAAELWRRMRPHVAPAERTLEVTDDLPRWERDIEGTWDAAGTNENILFSRYEAGGHFAPHTDGYSVVDFNHRSMYSIILFLNDGDGGGGTRFYTDAAKDTANLTLDAHGRWTAPDALALATVDAVAGRALVFYHNHIHEGRPPNPGARKYIIRSDVMFARRDPVCTLPQDVEAYELYQRAIALAGEGHEAEALPLFTRAFKISPNLADVYGM